jgi:predicted small secreted protein
MNTAYPTPHKALPAVLLACAFLALALGGCNTIAGLGEDVEAAGGAVEQEAEEEKRY